MAAPQRRTLVLLVALTVALTVGGCDSGCGDFDPRSRPLPLGESVAVDVEVRDGRLYSDVDVNGGYYHQPRRKVRLEQGGTNSVPSPYLTAPAGKRTAVVRHTKDGLLLTVEQQSFLLHGPIGCE